jgi:Ca2+-transporting ATPase
VREWRPEAAQTAAFVTIALAELAFVYACRSDSLPSWRLGPNRWLGLAVAASAAALAAIVYLPLAHEPFGTVPLSTRELCLVLLLALVPAAAAEAAKAVGRTRSSRAAARLAV